MKVKVSASDAPVSVSPSVLDMMTPVAEQMIMITSGLGNSDKNCDLVPVSKVAEYLKTRKECYERTQPTERDASRTLNRAYIDLDGEVEAEMYEKDFDALVKSINIALVELFKDDNVAIKQSCKWKCADDKGHIKNILSYTLHFTKVAGTRKAIQHFATSKILKKIQDALKDIIKVMTVVKKTKKGNYMDTLIMDLSVYSNGRKMRMFGQTKPLQDRPYKMLIGTTKDSYITYIPEGCEILQEPQSILQLVEIKEAPEPKEDNPQDENLTHSDYTIVSDPSEEDAKQKELIFEVLNSLHQHRWDYYPDWIKIGFVMNNENLTLAEYIEVSKKSKHFRASTSPSWIRDKWKGFVKGNLNQGLLWKWLSEDDLEKYMELSQKRLDFWALLRNPNHSETARFYYNLKPDAYVYSEGLGWFQLTVHNTWKMYGKDKPSGLLASIAHTLKKAVKEHQGQIDLTETEDEEKAKIMKAKYKALVRFAGQIGNRGFVDGVIAFLQDCYKDDDLDKKINAKKELFAFKDKVYDLDANEVRDIEPEDFISRTTGYNYPEKRYPEARIEMIKTVRSIFETEEEINNNPLTFSALTSYILKTLALSLHGRKKHEKFFVWTGTGGNGKGVLNDMLKRVLGDYFHPIPITLLTRAPTQRDGTCSALFQAQGTRCVMAEEPEADDKLQVACIKEWTGGGEISARELFGRSTRFMPQFCLYLQTNNIPQLSRPDGGIQRRLEIIEFPFQFVDSPSEPHHKLKNLEVKESIVKSEEWRDELWFLLLDAYHLLNKDGLDKPACVIEKTKKYMDKQNPIKAWFDENYTTEGISKTKKAFWIGSDYLRKQFMNMKSEEISSDKFKGYMEMMGIQSVEPGHQFKCWSYRMKKVIDEWVGEWEMVENRGGRYWVGLKRHGAPSPPEND